MNQQSADSIDSHIMATPADCERTYAALRLGPRTVGGLHDATGIPRIRIIDALEQMERRGAVRHDMALWTALEVRP